MLLSKAGINIIPYHEWDEGSTWEGCTLRTWLNYDYLSDAFSEKEQNMIQSTWISNEDNPEYGTEGGNDTYDKVFLLSIEEVERYFSSDEERICIPSSYANKRSVELWGSGCDEGCWWWVRSPGVISGIAAYVNSNGSVNYNGDFVINGLSVVRPALWINLDS